MKYLLDLSGDGISSKFLSCRVGYQIVLDNLGQTSTPMTDT